MMWALQYFSVMYDSLFCTYKPKLQRHSKGEFKHRARQHFRVLPGNLYPIHHLTHAELRRGYLNSRDLFFYFMQNLFTWGGQRPGQLGQVFRYFYLQIRVNFFECHSSGLCDNHLASSIIMTLSHLTYYKIYH